MWWMMSGGWDGASKRVGLFRTSDPSFFCYTATSSASLPLSPATSPQLSCIIRLWLCIDIKAQLLDLCAC